MSSLLKLPNKNLWPTCFLQYHWNLTNLTCVCSFFPLWFSSRLRWPEPIYMRVGYVFKLRFSAERFNRFLWFFASSIKNGRTLRNCCLFYSWYKNVWDISICLEPHFYEKKNVNNFATLKTDFSLTSANKPQGSLVLYL